MKLNMSLRGYLRTSITSAKENSNIPRNCYIKMLLLDFSLQVSGMSVTANLHASLKKK
jgi:hypothetical protein